MLTSATECTSETQLSSDSTSEISSNLNRKQILATDSYGFPLSIFTKVIISLKHKIWGFYNLLFYLCLFLRKYDEFSYRVHYFILT